MQVDYARAADGSIDAARHDEPRGQGCRRPCFRKRFFLKTTLSCSKCPTQGKMPLRRSATATRRSPYIAISPPMARRLMPLGGAMIGRSPLPRDG